MKNPNIIDAIVNGGSPMILFLIWALISFVSITAFYMRKLRKPPSFLMVFPLGFGLLAISYWALQTHLQNLKYLEGLANDPSEYLNNSLRISRASLIICVAAGISFIPAFIAFWLPKPLPEEQ